MPDPSPPLAAPARTNAVGPTGRRLVASYHPAGPGYDEAMDAAGGFRAPWQPLMDAFGRFRDGEFAGYADRARQLLHENGVTYNVYGDPRNAARAIDLDLVPLMLGEAEWAGLERGLIQRARLVNALLSDVYGPQTMIRDGVLPPSLMHSNPDYLRPVRGFSPPGGLWLHLYAADLGRGQDGRWHVVADRARTPGGAGYAVENRIVTSRSLGDIYSAANVRRLAPWFDTLRRTLHRLAHWTSNPRIVLLTPGPYNEAFFEHAYLARYLNFTLVEGADITVRDDRVFLKTLGGLEPVDVILRRVDDDFCDPLELRGDSALGTAGLVQAARLGNVVIANALGSGFAETPALLPYLPRLAEALLGETLILPHIETHWSGDREDFRPRLERASDLQPAFPRVGVPPPESRDAWIRHLRESPYDGVAQPPFRLSNAPTYGRHGLEARPVMMRVFLAAAADGYAVMPGALVRVAPDPERPRMRLQEGGISKDAWVVSSAPVDEFSLLADDGTQVGEVRRRGNHLPSRVADDLYWVGRYAERAEFGIRSLRAFVLRLTDGGGPGARAEIGPAARFLAETGEIPRDLARLATTDRKAFGRLLLPALFDEGRRRGFYNTLLRLNSNWTTVRDRLSLDMSRVLVRLHNHVETMRTLPPGDFVSLLTRFDAIVGAMASVSGLGMENMVRGQAWQFMDLGRRIERAWGAVALGRHLMLGGPGGKDRALDYALEIADSFMTYRARYFAAAQLAPVLDLLLLDEDNPRSLAFQLSHIAGLIDKLPLERDGPATGSGRLLIQAALSEVRAAEIPRLAGTDARGRHRELEALLDALAETLPELSDILSQTYFSHALARRPSGPIRTVGRP